ncbi:MAG: hypothetical protein KF893_10955 [Caldilineaceae bacterium]|nr:hypothetical protein [Caldilineaceae bacterium]
MEDEQIAVIEQKGGRFVAYLLGQSQIRAEGVTQEEALERLGTAVHQHLQRSRTSAPPVQNVIIHSNRK